MAKNAREGNAHPTEIATQPEKVHGNVPNVVGVVSAASIRGKSAEGDRPAYRIVQVAETPGAQLISLDPSTTPTTNDWVVVISDSQEHVLGELNTLKVAMTSAQHETDMIGSRIDDKLAHLQQKVAA